MDRIRTSQRLLLSALLLLPPLAQSQSSGESPDFLRDFIWPGNGASAVDEVWVLYAENCGRPEVDPTRPAEITFGESDVTVDIFLVDPPSDICPAVVLPDTLHAVSLGTLEKGTHDVQRRLHSRPADSGDYRLLLESWDEIAITDAPNAAASGTWYDPQSAGDGVVLNLLPHPAEQDGQAILFLATGALDGSPEWLSGMGRFEDTVLTLPLRRAGTDGRAPPDATGVFGYLGCNRATLRVDGFALAFPIGTAELQQLTKTDSVPTCAPPEKRPPDLD